MKLTHFWGLSLGLAVGYATAADSSYDASTGTGTVWAKGVSQTGGDDANKNDSFDGAADDLMCYAGCASNLIAWLHGEWSKDGAAEIDFRALFESGACISLAICADSTALSHGITLWGVEYENGVLTKLWLTDFDDAWVSSDPRLFSATVSVAENGKIYITGTENDLEDWYFYGSHDVYIDSVYALNAAASANWKLVPEPATASLSLVALAAMAVRRRRK